LVIVIVLSLTIFLVNLLFSFLFPRLNESVKDEAGQLKLSILIAFKNERDNLESLIKSLSKLTYPADKFEIILVDDGSTDNSFEKASELCKGKGNYFVVKADNKKYPGKKGALELGIKKASHPYILVTDADCQPQHNWLNGYSKKFQEGFDLLFGLAPFVQSKNVISKISCFENLRSSILTFVLAKIGLPYSAAARNIGFKKSSFEKIGGFSNTLETPSGDDDLLIREAVKNKLKIGIVSEKDSLVFTKSKETFKEYLSQKARHTKTSHHYLPEHKMILGSWHLFNILVLFSVLLLPVNLFFAIPGLVKLSSDILVILKIQNMFHYKFRIHEIILQQAVYEMFLIVNFLFSFRRNIIWKN
jgi:cellulose synthase/poly-beta-1,6-N-acetylglucosamine synthase-like glycosyltransferase